MPDLRRRLATALCLAAWLLPAPALAGAGEHELGAGLTLDDARRPGMALSGLWWWTDLVGAGAVLDAAAAPDGASLPTRIAARGEVRVAIDALTWVPWLEAGVGWATHPQTWDHGLLLRAGAGVAWRGSRAYSLQLRVAWERAALLRGGDTLQLLIGVAWHRGGAGELDF